MANKITYGLSNLHYSVISVAVDGKITYGTPVSIPGAVEMSLEAKGEQVKKYADNVLYWSTKTNDGYEGDVTATQFPDKFKEEVLGWIRDKNKVLLEKNSVLPKDIALGGQIEADGESCRFWLYKVTPSRPGFSSKTKEENIDPQDEKISVVCAAAQDTDIYKATCTSDNGETYKKWFDKVYLPTEAEKAGE